jgi:hypothetical protein
MKTWRIFLLLMTFFSYSCLAQSESDTAILEMEKQLERLNKVNFHPNLLPII